MKEYPSATATAGGDPPARATTAIRHAAIRRLLAAHRVERQEQLQELLVQERVAVTQATLSRDLKVMGVAKVPNAEGYVYRVPDGPPLAQPVSLAGDLARGVLAAELSGNLMIIKTQSGHGNSVAEALDRLGLPELAGTVAGDNTILAVIREGVAREQLLSTLAVAASPLHAWLA